MRTLVLMLSLLATHAASTATAVGTTDAACVWNGFDLSGLVGEYARIGFGPNEELDTSVCAALPTVAKTCNPTGNQASACLDLSVGAGQDQYSVLGYWTANDAAVWNFINNDDGGAGIQYSLTGDNTCTDASGQPALWQTVVSFPCASVPVAAKATMNGCTVTLIFPTPASCKPTGPSTPPGGKDDGGVSAGTIAAILITLLLVFGGIGGLLWWMNKTGRLERVKAAFGSKGMNDPLLAPGTGGVQV